MTTPEHARDWVVKVGLPLLAVVYVVVRLLQDTAVTALDIGLIATLISGGTALAAFSADRGRRDDDDTHGSKASRRPGRDDRAVDAGDERRPLQRRRRGWAV